MYSYVSCLPTTQVDAVGRHGISLSANTSSASTACCILQWSDRPRRVRRCYRERWCPTALSPKQCCTTCSRPAQFPGRGRHSLAEAIRGTCCICTLAVQRESWAAGAYTHHILVLECPHFQKLVDLNPGMYRNINDPPTINKEKQTYNHIAMTKQLLCSEGEDLRSQLDDEYPLRINPTDDYCWWSGDHCRSFAFKWYLDAPKNIGKCN